MYTGYSRFHAIRERRVNEESIEIGNGFMRFIVLYFIDLEFKVENGGYKQGETAYSVQIVV